MNIQKLIELRKNLHQYPEASGAEKETADIIRSFFKDYPPEKILDNIGGFGLAAVYSGKNSGPTVLIRCELDALPILEENELEYSSKNKGYSHKCGHDGHMAILSGLGTILFENPPSSGRVVLLFQPAEENGQGAYNVISCPKFQEFIPDYVFALHNLPGYQCGKIVLRKNTFASASKGLICELAGATSHAAEPENGRNPALALASIIQAMSCIPQFYAGLHESVQVTVIHALLGEVAFGTSPGKATLMATLRSHEPKMMQKISEKCLELIAGIAKTYQLNSKTIWTEEFPATVNDEKSTEIIENAARQLEYDICYREHPFAWSEDFGYFTSKYPGALFGLGIGEEKPGLHHPDYDFPDEVIQTGVLLFEKITRSILG